MIQEQNIREWVTRRFENNEPKVFIELGSNIGQDTDWMARIPNTAIYSCEPDPRCLYVPHPNVRRFPVAVTDRCGPVDLVLSAKNSVCPGMVWTASSSISAPKQHLKYFPGVTFGESIKVAGITLDWLADVNGLDQVDFIWCDIQGAEGQMVAGGTKTLARTKFLYTEYSNNELYEGQVGLQTILDRLFVFRVLEDWPEPGCGYGNVLLERVEHLS